ncbi:ATP-binding protein, partial [Shewanella sp. 0m-11]
QVLINLIKNSLDAIADSDNARTGQISIELDFKESQVNISILDNGPGLALEADTLMATFYTTKVDGLGLGLAICREVIKEHDGHFVLANRCDEQSGCVARVHLKKRGSEQAVTI